MMKFFLTPFLAALFSITISAQELLNCGHVDYYHAKVMDADNHLDSWHKDENGSFEYILNLNATWWKNAPNVEGWPIWCTAATVNKEYEQDNGAVPGSVCYFAIMACLKYYVHTGDTSYLYLAKRTGDYIIKQDLTPSSFVKYPGFPYAVGNTGSIYPQGFGHPAFNENLNPIYSIQPDKGAMLGVALLELYKVTGNIDYLTTSVNIANCLSRNVKVGTPFKSPWPMRVMANHGGTVDGKFSSNVSFACRLFDELFRIGQCGNGKYKVTRDAVWTWLKDEVISHDDASRWKNYFEDHSGDEINPTQINALETVRYLLEKKGEADSDWYNLSGKIINQVTKRWSNSTLGKSGYVCIGEQETDKSPYNSHTARYGSVLAMYVEAGANETHKDVAYHSLCYGLYSVENDGFTSTYYQKGNVAWTNDSFGDFLYHYMDALAAMPEWAGSVNYLLKSSSAVKKVSYVGNRILYSTFDEFGTDKLKLVKAPVSIKVDGMLIKSYSWDSAAKVLIISRSTGRNVVVE